MIKGGNQGSVDPTDQEKGQRKQTESLLKRYASTVLSSNLYCQLMGITVLEGDGLHVRDSFTDPMELALCWQKFIEGTNLHVLVQENYRIEALRAGEILIQECVSVGLWSDREYMMMTLIPIMLAREFVGIVHLYQGVDSIQVGELDLNRLKILSDCIAVKIQYERELEERERLAVEQEVAQEELERLKRIKNNLVVMIGREFKTALRDIQRLSEIIRDQDLSSETRKELAGDIHVDARRLVHIINDLQDLERMEAGRVRLNVEWLDLNAIIRIVMTQLRPEAPQHLIRMRLAKALPILLGDREKLTQVITNIVSNAIEYAPDGGEIVISSMVEGNLVHVRVSDQGVGIELANLERIFEPYPQREGGMLCYLQGSGLGLPIAREIIQLHGGEIWVESAVNKGSIFHFTISFSD